MRRLPKANGLGLHVARLAQPYEIGPIICDVRGNELPERDRVIDGQTLADIDAAVGTYPALFLDYLRPDFLPVATAVGGRATHPVRRVGAAQVYATPFVTAGGRAVATGIRSAQLPRLPLKLAATEIAGECHRRNPPIVGFAGADRWTSVLLRGATRGVQQIDLGHALAATRTKASGRDHVRKPLKLATARFAGQFRRAARFAAPRGCRAGGERGTATLARPWLIVGGGGPTFSTAQVQSVRTAIAILPGIKCGARQELPTSTAPKSGLGLYSHRDSLPNIAGSGTTLLVADRLGREAVGIELSEAYAQLARERLAGDAPLWVDMAEMETAGDYAPLGLFGGAAS